MGYTTPQLETKEAQDKYVKNNKNAYLPHEILNKCENYKNLGDYIKKYDYIWTEVKTTE